MAKKERVRNNVPNTALTSIYSYYDLRGNPKKLGKLQREVYDCIRTHGPIHNRYISELTGIEINVVTPRVGELRKLGFVKKAGTKRDPHTKKLVTTWCQAKVMSETADYFESLISKPLVNQGVLL